MQKIIFHKCSCYSCLSKFLWFFKIWFCFMSPTGTYGLWVETTGWLRKSKGTEKWTERLLELSRFSLIHSIDLRVCSSHCSAVLPQRWENTHFGGQRMSSRNSSILLTSVLTSPLKVMKGGCVPGARFWRSAGFLKDKWSNFSGLKQKL